MKQIIFLTTILLLTSCTNLEKKESREKEKLYLQNKFEVLVSTKVNETNRKHLEEEYIKYQNKLLAIKSKKKNSEEVIDIDRDLRDASIKIQNLKDLQD